MAKRKSQPRLNLLTETVRRRRRCQKKETSRQLYDGNKLKSKSPAKKKKNKTTKTVLKIENCVDVRYRSN